MRGAPWHKLHSASIVLADPDETVPPKLGLLIAASVMAAANTRLAVFNAPPPLLTILTHLLRSQPLTCKLRLWSAFSRVAPLTEPPLRRLKWLAAH
jgi:hypothetical protein